MSDHITSPAPYCQACQQSTSGRCNYHGMQYTVTSGFVHVTDCMTQHGRKCCMHRLNTTLTTNPPTPIDVCCHCGTQIYRYDLQNPARRPFDGHGPYAP